jgi:hypothetical protein
MKLLIMQFSPISSHFVWTLRHFPVRPCSLCSLCTDSECLLVVAVHTCTAQLALECRSALALSNPSVPRLYGGELERI